MHSERLRVALQMKWQGLQGVSSVQPASPSSLEPPSAAARDLAAELVVLATAAARIMLGEQKAGVRLVEE